MYVSRLRLPLLDTGSLSLALSGSMSWVSLGLFLALARWVRARWW